jgi:hypothetical protein
VGEFARETELLGRQKMTDGSRHAFQSRRSARLPPVSVIFFSLTSGNNAFQTKCQLFAPILFAHTLPTSYVQISKFWDLVWLTDAWR